MQIGQFYVGSRQGTAGYLGSRPLAGVGGSLVFFITITEGETEYLLTTIEGETEYILTI